MKTIKKRILFVLTILVSFSIFIVPFADLYDGADGDFESISFTNSIGTTVTFSEPAQKVATLGIAFTTTVIELGLVDDIVMIDNYSDPNNSGITGLEGFPSESIFSVGNGEQIAQNLANGYGGFDRNRDVVIIYGYSYHGTAIKNMETLGLKVVTFYPKTYEDGIKMVRDIGAIMGEDSKANEIADRMESTVSGYAEALSGVPESERIKAIYVSYSGGKIKVGNVNSFAIIMIKLAGGTNPADNTSMTGSALTSYEVDDTIFLQLEKDVIFLDPVYEGTPSSFRAEKNLSNDVKIYKLEKTMIQYGPTSLEGVEYMAMAMYPDLFGYLEEDLEGIPDNEIWRYTVGGLFATLMVATIFVYMRP